MHVFKIGLKEVILLITLAAPLGVFLLLSNYSKINYEIKARRGYAITENFCENYAYEKNPLMKDSSVPKVYENDRIDIVVRNDLDIYIIRIKGYIADQRVMAEMGEEALKEISVFEISVFNNLYKNIKLHCKSGVFPVFKMASTEKISNNFTVTKRYKNFYLGFIFILPFFIFYLLIIAYKYINNIL